MGKTKTYTKKEIKKRATEIYDKILDTDYFEQAYELFPKYNWDQASEATDFIMEQVELHLITDRELKNWDKTGLREEVSEMVFAGLT